MPTTTIICGVLLILIGIIGYGYGMIGGKREPDGFDSRRFGLILAILGFAAKAKGKFAKTHYARGGRRRLLGFLGTASSFLKIPALLNGTAERRRQSSRSSPQRDLCIFVLLCVKSFADARRNRAV
jgi:hypothetical protein